MAATQRSTVTASDATDSRPLTRVLPSVLRSMPLGVFVLTLADGRLLDLNEAQARMLGYGRDELVGRSVVEAGLLADRGGLEQLAEAVRGSSEAIDVTLRTRDGEERVFEAAATIVDLDGQPCIAATTRDASARRAAERTLREAEERFQLAFVEAPIGMALTCLEGADSGRFLQVNRALCELTGYSERELLARRFQDITHPDDLPDSLVGLERMCRGEVSSYETDERYVRRDGQTVWVHVHVTLLHDADGKPLGCLAQVLDITERKLAEQALRASEQRYRGIVESATDGVWMLDELDRTIFVNRAMADMLGYEVRELLGRLAVEFMRDQTEPIGRHALRRRREGQTHRYEARLRRKDGRELWAEMSATPLLDERDHYSGAVCMVADMTERRQARLERDQLEARLAQSQRLETVGQLAGGIAHDFNNLLAVILNYAYFVRQQLAEDSSVRADVDEIRRAAERASELTHQLLVFSRREAVRLEVLDVNEVVRDMERLMRRTIGENVVLLTELDEDPCMVKADAAQLEQVVLNLVVNSRDAMPGGGTVTIATRRVELTGDRGQAPPSLAPGSYVFLSVRDDGEGMEPDVAAHAFEPFFTTKPKGAGTGLGLATVYGTVTQCGGEADIRSAPGEGSEVRVWLPETLERTRAVRDAPEGANGSAGETVLVVEDEDAVRQLTCRILESGGFRCLSASGGEEALRLHGEAETHIDLLLTDVVIPGMSGRELAERIAAEGSRVPVLFMSGYTDDVVDRHALPPGATALVHKPFTAASLLRSVHQALEDRRPA